MCRRLVFLSILTLMSGPSAAQAQESHIIVHALNPEGVEIASIEGMNPYCVEILDGEEFIGYGPYDEQTHNVSIPITPGAHIIKALFNGMTLEQGVNLEPDRTQTLTFVFARSEISNVDLFTIPETTNSTSGVQDIWGWSYWWGDCMSLSPFYVHNITSFASYSWSLKTGHMTVPGKWWCDPISVNVEGIARSTVTGEPSESGVESVQLRVDIKRHTPLQISIPYPVFFDTWYVQNNSAKVSQVWAFLFQEPWAGYGSLVEHWQTGYYINGISAAQEWTGIGILPWHGPALTKEVTFPEHIPDVTVEGSVSYTLTGETLKFSSVPYDLLGTGIHCGGGGPPPPPENQPPVASFKSLNVTNLGHPEYETTNEDYHMVGGVIRFDATDSNDPDGGEIQHYYWDFAGGQFERLPSPDQKPDVVFKEAKVYTITLVVVDDEGSESKEYTESLDLSLKKGDLIFLRSGFPYAQAFDLIDNFYTHVGIYIGDQQMIESIKYRSPRSNKKGVVITPLSGWSYPSETYAVLMRVRTANDKIIQGAIDFAKGKVGQQYDTRLWQKSLDQRNYYCSELIWAAYYSASQGSINLGLKRTGGLWDWFTPVSPDDMIIHDNVNFGELIGLHQELCP